MKIKKFDTSHEPFVEFNQNQEMISIIINNYGRHGENVDKFIINEVLQKEMEHYVKISYDNVKTINTDSCEIITKNGMEIKIPTYTFSYIIDEYNKFVKLIRKEKIVKLNGRRV